MVTLFWSPWDRDFTRHFTDITRIMKVKRIVHKYLIWSKIMSESCLFPELVMKLAWVKKDEPVYDNIMTFSRQSDQLSLEKKLHAQEKNTGSLNAIVTLVWCRNKSQNRKQHVWVSLALVKLFLFSLPSITGARAIWQRRPGSAQPGYWHKKMLNSNEEKPSSYFLSLWNLVASRG